MESRPNNVRKLEEQLYHLLACRNYFQVKQLLSTIENFLILFNPGNKLALFEAWAQLVAAGYDPVIEYSKSFELFEMNYQPSVESIFTICLQLCRFFKELGDFEVNTSLPEFRHPLIQNRLLTTGAPDLETNSEDQAPKEKSWRDRDNRIAGDLFFDESRVEADDFSVEIVDEERNDHSKKITFNYLEDIGLLREIKRLHMYDPNSQLEVLHGYEKANVDIPAGKVVRKASNSNICPSSEDYSKVRSPTICRSTIKQTQRTAFNLNLILKQHAAHASEAPSDVSRKSNLGVCNLGNQNRGQQNLRTKTKVARRVSISTRDGFGRCSLGAVCL